MAFRVFLSYSLDPAEQALAWRLQTLAAAHGIKMFVPVRGETYPPHPASALPAIEKEISQSDCVLAIIAAQPGKNVIEELNYALAKRVLVVPIVAEQFANQPWITQFQNRFVLLPADPGKIEGEIVQFLKQQQISKEQQQALTGLAALGIGLLLLYSLTEK